MGKVNPYQSQDPGTYCVGCEIPSEYFTMFVNGTNVRASQDGVGISISQYFSIIDGLQFDMLMMQSRARLAGWRKIRPQLLDPPAFGRRTPGRIGIPSNKYNWYAYADFETAEGVTRNYYEPVFEWSFGSTAFNSNGSVFSFQTVLLAPLEEKKGNAVRNAIAELAERLKQGKVGSDCKKYVLDQLATLEGFSLEKFISFLEQGGNFYDGEKSTAAMSDYYASGAPPGGWTISISEYFERNEGVHAFTASGPKVSGFTVFFDPDFIETELKQSSISTGKVSGVSTSNLAFFFHEALHGFGNSLRKLTEEKSVYDDEGLKKLFGLESSGSKVISDHIEQNCIK